MTKPISEMIAWLEGEKNERENALPHKEYRYGTITEKEKDIAIIDAILAALSGPSEEERQNLLGHCYGHLVGWHDRATCPKCLEIEALILGHAREEKK